MDIIELAKEWLMEKRNGDIEGIEILPQLTTAGTVIWFYDEKTLIDLPYFLTIPMVKSLLNGKLPKNVINEYLKNTQCNQINQVKNLPSKSGINILKYLKNLIYYVFRGH